MVKPHWNARYIFNRSAEFLFRKVNPGLPWLTQDAISFLKIWLSGHDTGLEFGSGRSTFWLSGKSKHLVSVEDNSAWYSRVSQTLKEQGVNNVDYRFCESIPDEPSHGSKYVMPLHEFPDEHFDYILIDGLHRDYLALHSIPKVKRSGVLIIDNANWFLPHKTNSPTSVGANGVPVNDTWRTFESNVRKWRLIWTSNGVTDTAIFIKTT